MSNGQGDEHRSDTVSSPPTADAIVAVVWGLKPSPGHCAKKKE